MFTSNYTSETIGTIIQCKYTGELVLLTVEYMVDGIRYTLKESVKYKIELIKLGKIPIGQHSIPKVPTTKVGGTLQIIYNPKNPKKSHIKGNDSILTWI